MIYPGQLLITGISGLTLSDGEKEFIESERIGGVILFAHNYENPAQLAELVNSIQQLREEYPLFISVDHEGGRVMRFKQHFTHFPSMLDIAKTDSPKLIYHVHKIMAEELSACGINLSYSPCCDVFSNPENKVIGDRSFGCDPETVSKYVSSAIRGLQTNGVLACAKHFPGHGSTLKDSHFDLPIVKTPMAELKEFEMPPFVKAVQSRVEFVMMAHLMVDAIDTDLPCSLSPKAHKILRGDLKYKKIIISDDMQMKAIADNWTIEEAAIMALEAGSDMLCYRDIESCKKGLGSIKDAMKIKRLKNDAITEKVDRVLDCKKRNLSEYSPIYIPSLTNKVGTKPSQIFHTDLKKKIEEVGKIAK
ncbi:MAG: beta-N-acetylhexosaminidase [Bacteriovoracaceae bacterium]|nr:beta-N-acetylhexosaminidase [Bacteriovoracaceae bacterium]